MKTPAKPAHKPLGRPRAFSPEDALDAATLVFQRQGYDGASLNDLTAAMGINRPSCYAAFGDKQALFLKALERYSGRVSELYRAAVAQPTAREAASHLLHETIALGPPTSPSATDQRSTCLLDLPTTPGGELEAAIRASRTSLDRALQRRLQRARREGDLPPTSDPAALTALLSLTMRGLVSQAAEGVSRAALLAQAETLLQLFPTQHVP